MGVAEVPSHVPLRLGHPKFEKFYVRTCLPAARQTLGTWGLKFARSNYTTYRYVPTAAQQKQGARWVSCLVGQYAGVGGKGRLAVTKGRIKPLKKLTRTNSICGTHRFEFTACSQRHVYRVRAAKVLSTTAKRAQSRAINHCRKVFRNDQDNWMWAYRRLGLKKYAVLCLNN